MKYKNQNDIKHIYITAGNVKYINSDSPYLVRYPDSLKGYVNITEQDNQIKISQSWDIRIQPFTNKTIKVNLNNLNSVQITQQKGNATVQDCTAISNFTLDSGNLNIKIRSDEVVEGKVGHGTLKNNSKGEVTEAEIKNGSSCGKTLSGNGAYMSINLFQQDMLASNFIVNNGNLKFQPYFESFDTFIEVHDQEYIEPSLSGNITDECTIM